MKEFSIRNCASSKGIGIQAWMLEQNQPIRLTQAELEVYSARKGLGENLVSIHLCVVRSQFCLWSVTARIRVSCNFPINVKVTLPLRMTTEVQDQDHMLFKMYHIGEDGETNLVTEIVHTRRN